MSETRHQRELLRWTRGVSAQARGDVLSDEEAAWVAAQTAKDERLAAEAPLWSAFAKFGDVAADDASSLDDEELAERIMARYASGEDPETELEDELQDVAAVGERANLGMPVAVPVIAAPRRSTGKWLSVAAVAAVACALLGVGIDRIWMGAVAREVGAPSMGVSAAPMHAERGVAGEATHKSLEALESEPYLGTAEDWRITDAESRLEAGDAAGALVGFDAYLLRPGEHEEQARYGRLRALNALERPDEARQAARTFLREFPESDYRPYALVLAGQD